MKIERILLAKNKKRTIFVIGNYRIRANRVFIIIIAILLFLATIWPGYPLFAGVEPMILGLPLSFAWLILCVLISFISMLALYFSDNKEELE